MELKPHPLAELFQQERDALAECSPGHVCRILEINPKTLQRWRRAGKIKATPTATGRFKYDLGEYLRRHRAMERT